MAESTYHFRSSLGGFHKGDVTAYIEKTATEHRSELLEYEKKISELQEENRSLLQQLNLLMMATPVSAPEAEVEAEPELEPEIVEEPEVEVEAEPEETVDLMQLELQAYRRAEAVERNANNRARLLFEEMEDLCCVALDDFQTADAAVKQTIEVIAAQAASLESAYQTLCAALSASQEKICAINKNYSVPEEVED